MNLNNVKLMIATPMYGGQASAHFTYFNIEFAKLATSLGLKFQHQFLYTESLITRGRNSLVKSFLDSNCTHFMFIDADIGFNPEDIIKLIKYDKEIVCGGYPAKLIDWDSVGEAASKGVPNSALKDYASPYIYNRVPDTEEKDGLIEVIEAGTGFMMIQRNVFKRLSDKVPSYIANQFGTNKEEIKEFFATSIENNILLSEDYHFCRLARRNGIKVYIDTTIDLQHIGGYVFTSSRNHYIR